MQNDELKKQNAGLLKRIETLEKRSADNNSVFSGSTNTKN